MSFKSFLFHAGEVLVCKKSRQCCTIQPNILSSRIFRICLRNANRTQMNLWVIFAVALQTLKKSKEENKIMRQIEIFVLTRVYSMELYFQAKISSQTVPGTQECEFFGSDFEFFTILLLIMLKY
jgi:hypothetical protein